MKTLTFKVSDDEASLIQSMARRDKVSVSEYLRRRAMGTSARKPKRIKSEFSGAPVFAPLDGYPPLTTESVREMLSDFP